MTLSPGFTGITNITRGGLNINELHHRLDEEGRLKPRMRIATTMEPTCTYDEALAAIKGRASFDSEMTIANTAKIFYDGVIESGTAVMIEPYLEAAYIGEEDADMHHWAEQALTPYQMLEAYTKNVAYQNFMENLTGTVEVGKRAARAFCTRSSVFRTKTSLVRIARTSRAASEANPRKVPTLANWPFRYGSVSTPLRLLNQFRTKVLFVPSKGNHVHQRSSYPIGSPSCRLSLSFLS